MSVFREGSSSLSLDFGFLERGSHDNERSKLSPDPTFSFLTPPRPLQGPAYVNILATKTFSSTISERVNASTTSFKGTPALCTASLLSWTAVFVVKHLQVVHKHAHEAALKFCDTWQMFSKLLDDTTNAETDVRHEKK